MNKSPRQKRELLIVDELKPPSSRQQIRRAGTTKIDLIQSPQGKKKANLQLMSPHGQSVYNCKKSNYGGSSYAQSCGGSNFSASKKSCSAIKLKGAFYQGSSMK